MTEHISRSELSVFKNEVEEAAANVKLAQDIFAHKSKAYKYMVLDYLGTTPSSMFADWAEEILDFTDRENLDPQWFFDQISSYVGMVLQPKFMSRFTKTGYPSFKPPEEQIPHAFASRAMELIAADGYGAQSYRHDVYEMLDKAVSLSADQAESNHSPSDQNENAVYRWLKDHYHIAYKIQAKSWWEHY